MIAATWLSYAGYYFCRKPFYKAKATLHKQVGLSTAALGWVGFGYLAAYCCGQFFAAALGTRIGPRRMVLGGMGVSVLCNLAAGSLAGFGPLLLTMTLNGLVQATGWPGNVGTMAAWTHREERGTVMGLWSTCYQLGGLLAGVFASLLVGGALGWRAPFWGGAAVLVVVTWLFWRWQRDSPQDLGFPALDEGGGARPFDLEAPPAAPGARRGLGWSRSTTLTVLLMGAIYACVKFIRYLLLSWAAFFLQVNFRLPRARAGLYAECFDFAGLFGAIGGGVVSDRVFGGRRTPVIVGMLALMTLACVFLWLVGPSSVSAFVIGLAAVGFMLYGPDSLLSAAGAMDVGTKHGAVAAAGIINGMGSLGSVLQEGVVGEFFAREGGLSTIFGTLVGAGCLALALVTLQAWRNRHSPNPL